VDCRTAAFRATVDLPATNHDRCDCPHTQVYIKLDQPNSALEGYQKASEKHPGETSLILGAARVHDMLNNMSQAVQFYKKVRVLCNLERGSCSNCLKCS
jgi:hypothetical protein